MQPMMQGGCEESVIEPIQDKSPCFRVMNLVSFFSRILMDLPVIKQSRPDFIVTVWFRKVFLLIRQNTIYCGILQKQTLYID